MPEADDEDDKIGETTQLPIEGESADSKQKLNLDDFELIKVIGRGSFGKVLLVKKRDDQ